jgi:gliding motility-associated-like protein
MKIISPRWFKPALLILFTITSYCVFGQIVGSNCFLQGCYEEVGISSCGVYGTTVLPPVAGGPFGPYHPKPEFFGGGTYFGFVADHQKDGWAAGTPNFCGDYFVPGSPVEGWQIQSGASVYTNTDVGCYLSNIPGSVTDYTDTGGYKSATWEGSIAALNLSVTQKTTFPDGALFFLTTVTLCNEGATDLTSIYYKRNVDPDQDEPWSGNYSTYNTVIYNPPVGDTALVTAEGQVYGCFLGIGAIDPRARVSYGLFGTTDATASNAWAGTGGYSGSGTTSCDCAAQITFKVDIAAGECTTINFAHVLDPVDLQQALQATLLGTIGVLADSVEVDTSGIVNACLGDSIHLDLLYADGYDWTWTPAAGLDTDTGSSVVAAPDTTTTYVAVGIGDCAELTRSITIEVHDLHDVADAGPDKFLCRGDTVELEGSGGVTYLWQPPVYLSNDTIATPLVQNPLTNAYYDLIIHDELGCSDTDQVVVSLYPDPVVDAGTDQTMIIGGFAQLNASGTVSYTWTPSESLSNALISNPFSYAEDTTVYTVIGIDANGCSDTDSVTVFVLDDIRIISPNAFTPNGDGLNDTYKPLLIGAGEIDEFEIYDRWGTLVYQSDDPQKGWDGTYKNLSQEVATYIVIIRGKDGYGTPIVKNASLILLR